MREDREADDRDAVGVEFRAYESRDRRAVWLVHEHALGGAWDAFDPEYNRYLRHVDRAFQEVGGAFLVGEVGGHPATRSLDLQTPDADSDVVAIGGFQPLGTLVYSLAALGLAGVDEAASVDTVAQVRSVAVAPDWQGRGIGRAVMRGLERRAGRAGFDHVVLQSPAALPDTHAFYESLDYEAVDSGVGDDYVWFHRWL